MTPSSQEMKSPGKSGRFSIGVDGQEIELHIIEEVPLARQKLTKFRCEVTSADSPYYQKVDWLYSEELLRRGHTYIVRLNENSKNPLIVELISEIERKEDDESSVDEKSE